MKLVHHLTLSAIISGFLYSVFNSWALSIASFISGVFTDLDHIIDYLLEHRSRLHVNEFFYYFYQEKHNKITLLFHGWEWLFILVIVTLAMNFNLWIVGVLTGYAHHIISDYLYNKTSLWTYSLTWRWIHKFDSKLLFPRQRGYNPRF